MNEPRINDPSEVHSNAIRDIFKAGRKPTVQFSRPGYSDKLLKQVNLLCQEFGDELEVRFYGHYQTCFDASVLANLPDAQSLSVDCLTEISNEDTIASLKFLKRLSFGVYKFDEPQFFEKLNVAQLTRLSLIENAKRNFDLSILAQAQNLKTLFINGHTKNIGALQNLHNLTDLTLSAIPKHQNLQFLCDIESLRSLSLILGGRSSMDEFRHPALENLSIIRVRGLETLGSLGRYPRLRDLHVEDQLQIHSIDFTGAPLQKVVLANCKNLDKIEGLEDLNQIAELRVSRTNLDLQALLDRDWPPSLEILALYSGSRKWNDAARAVLDKRGYREWAKR
jgi:hypothetical protein